MPDLPRSLLPHIQAIARGFPALCVTGPRQAGKSTLVRMAFPDLPYRDCKDASTFALAQDPVGFLRQLPAGAIIDEAQRVPHLLEHLQTVIDAQRVMGRWILTGSENLGLMKTLSESLAGRVATLNLLPFSHHELAQSERRPRTLAQAVLLGGYPPLYDQNRDLEPWRWLSNYLDTYVQRDVLSLLRIQDRTAFWRFMQLCARHVGCQTNAQQWGAEIGKDSKTIAGWISVLEATFILRLVPISSHTFGKRMSKHPKLYFYDTGLACRLLGMTDVNQAFSHPQWGLLAENWCYMEVLKNRWHHAKSAEIGHWRTSDGHEVDLVLDAEAALHPIEIKASETMDPSMSKGLANWIELGKKRGNLKIAHGTVIYGGDRELSLENHRFIPWHSIEKAFQEVST